ncbi:MAG: DinB family protein [Phycisphaerales bacterium]
MNPAAMIDRLERFADVLPATIAMVDEADARWKPASGNWSILEIVRHLGDEEREDFRMRLGLTLQGAAEWPKIDPPGWAVERKYNEADLGAAVATFIRERRASVEWLRGLGDPAAIDWNAAYQHPKFGPIHAGVLLGSWAAHDALHLRQIAKRLFELAGRDAAPHTTIYAGEWTA